MKLEAGMSGDASRSDDAEPGAVCSSCGTSLARRMAFLLPSGGGTVWKCLRCSFVDRALMLRSAKVAGVVGCALVLLNQGDQLVAGTFPWHTWYKIPLTFLVPFCVATYGALSNGYRGGDRGAAARDEGG